MACFRGSSSGTSLFGPQRSRQGSSFGRRNSQKVTISDYTTERTMSDCSFSYDAETCACIRDDLVHQEVGAMSEVSGRPCSVYTFKHTGSAEDEWCVVQTAHAIGRQYSSGNYKVVLCRKSFGGGVSTCHHHEVPNCAPKKQDTGGMDNRDIDTWRKSNLKDVSESHITDTESFNKVRKIPTKENSGPHISDSFKGRLSEIVPTQPHGSRSTGTRGSRHYRLKEVVKDKPKGKAHFGNVSTWGGSRKSNYTPSAQSSTDEMSRQQSIMPVSITEPEDFEKNTDAIAMESGMIGGRDYRVPSVRNLDSNKRSKHDGHGYPIYSEVSMSNYNQMNDPEHTDTIFNEIALRNKNTNYDLIINQSIL